MSTLLVSLLAAAGTVALLWNGLAYWHWQRLRRTHQDCMDDAPEGVLALRAFVIETAASALAFPVPLPLRNSGNETQPRRVAVIAPGLNRYALAYRILARRLRRAGWTPRICPYPTLPVHVDHSARALEAAVAACTAAEEIVLIGHGIGGLVALSYLQRTPSSPVRRLFTIATPHCGSFSVASRIRFGDIVDPSGAFLRQVRAGYPIPDRLDVTSIYSNFDAWIAPPRAADCPGAFNIQIKNCGHFTLLVSKRTFDILLENLEAG